ncbi:LytR/AlgR family response regulator transcription factor [Taibaiella koreensis]|uniref:LytR/AlgR family response regulator transcription factor n=1 Tax=Taibaiella koreensis TaxID=1268548 RepID=UPI000E59E5CE|nr:LytTR family DNA-binding domain-containing protein [Taibaiella koreensis]
MSPTGKIKAVLVEDEAAAMAALQSYIQKFCPQVQICGTAQNSREAISVLHEIQPELVFLDVEMPFGNAFDVLDACQDLQFETIFVTAFSEYSLKALNQSAAYYLLKPVSIEELILAVTKVQQQLQQQRLFNRNQIIVANARETKPEKQQVILPTLDGFDVVKMEEIVRLKGNGNFTDVFLADGRKKMVCRFLKHFTEILPHPFLRVHKSHVINIHFVKSYHKGTGGYLTLQDGTEVEVSAAYKDQLLEAFR